MMLHDGELADVRALAESVGARVVECRPSEAPAAWDVLVASGRYARGDAVRGGAAHAVRIAVLDRHARSMRAVVRRAGIDLVVRRPVHPAALRLLLLHALYRGPERRTRRVAVGSAVRFRTGFRRRDGILADLSMRGCQILAEKRVRVGQSVVVWIPDAAHASRSFALRGRVVRTLVTDAGEHGFGVDFGKVDKDLAAHLKLAVLAYADGPAACPHASAAPHADPGVTQPLAAFAETHAHELDPNETTHGACSVAADCREAVRAAAELDGGCTPAPTGAERREAARHVYEGRRVVALGEQAARVLIGRDLSIGGMRVDRSVELRLGQSYQIAIHVAPGQTPLVLSAEVVRDDGARGYALRFVDVTALAERYLRKMVDSLPVQEDEQGVVVSEIVRSDA
ncbi:MAG: hypothetical protein DCC71_05005 [Proteobacteria bacterium]|nr:MAG: hypothetical protein DCC71_05005 [Pseudomonadota bacterium]